MDEPLLTEIENRYSFLPAIEGRESILDELERQRSSFWRQTQVSMKEDKIHWKEGILYPNTTNKEEKEKNESAAYFLKRTLAFFSGFDMIVIDNIVDNFINEMPWREVSAVYQWQTVMEGIHAQSYAIQLDQLISDQEERNILFNSIVEIPCVKKMADWAFKFMDTDEVKKKYGKKSLAVRLIAFAGIEGIAFSGPFASIYWLQSLNRMPGLADYNKLIARDEGMHTDFACLLYNKYIKNHLTSEETYEVIGELTELSVEFMTDAIPCDMIGMKKENMAMYIKFVSNRLLNQLGYDELYKNVQNPFPYMNKISMKVKTNFFERRPQEYNTAITSKFYNNKFSDNAEF